MTTFGDYDPDDTWDATDPPDEQLRILGQRIAWLIEHRDDLPARVGRILYDIGKLRERLTNG